MNRIPHLSTALIAVGAAFTLFVVAQLPGEVFFSGDGALKTLHAKQHLERGFSVELDLEAEPWVRELWSGGLYPFKPPFVYEQDGRYIVGFPFLFPLLTVPFYKLAGFRGLYILPLASLWLLWLFFKSHCRRIRLEPLSALIGLALLILASPLTLYGAIYWEHVPAALLAFFGLEFLAGLYAGRRAGMHPLLYGLLAGLAVWLRAEYILFLAPVVALLLPVALQLLKSIRNRRLIMLAHLTLGAALLAGAYQNLYVRTAQLIKDYSQRVWPAMEVVRNHPARYVVVPNPWTAQELQATFADKSYFHATSIEDGVRLAEALAERGVHRFLAVLHFEDSAPARVVVAEPSPIERLEFSSLGLHGSYYVLEATIVPRR